MIKFLIPTFLSLKAKACHVEAEYIHIEPYSDFGVVLPDYVVRPAAIGLSVGLGSPACAVGGTQIIPPAIGAVGVVNTGAVGVVATGGCGGTVGVVATGGCGGAGAIILCQTESECCE